MAPMRAPTHLELNMPRVLNGALDVAGAVSESSLSLSLHGKEGQGGPVSCVAHKAASTSECARVAESAHTIRLATTTAPRGVGLHNIVQVGITCEGPLPETPSCVACMHTAAHTVIPCPSSLSRPEPHGQNLPYR